MKTVLFIAHPVILFALACAWAWCLADALRNHRAWSWVVAMILTGPLGAAAYVVNFHAPGAPQGGRLERVLGDSIRLRGLYADARDRDLIPTWKEIATIHIRRQEWRPALDALRRVNERAPEDLRAHLQAGHVMTELGHPREALEHLEYVESVDPRYAWGDLLIAKARALDRLGDEGSAFAALEEYAREYSTPEGLVMYARGLVARGRVDEARAALKRTLDHAGALDAKAVAEHAFWLRVAKAELRALDEEANRT